MGKSDEVRVRVIARIKKLFEVTEERGAAESEAIQAALLAQRLIAEHDVTAEELRGDERHVVEVQGAPFSRELWRDNLVSVVAVNFRCRVYVSGTRVGRRKIIRNYVFVGYGADAQAANLVYERLAGICGKLMKKAVRDARMKHGTSRGVKEFFARGFAEGVRRELEKQSRALMLVVPKEVDDEFRKKRIGKAKKHRCVYSAAAGDAVDAGFDAGREAVRAGRVKGGGEHVLDAQAAAL